MNFEGCSNPVHVGTSIEMKKLEDTRSCALTTKLLVWVNVSSTSCRNVDSWILVCQSNIAKYYTLPHNGSLNMLIGHTYSSNDINSSFEEDPWLKGNLPIYLRL